MGTNLLSKTDLDKLKSEYAKTDVRRYWSREEKDLIKQLLENGIQSGKFIHAKFFPDRTVGAVDCVVSSIRVEMRNEKDKS